MSGSEYSNRVPKGFVRCTCVNKGRLIGLITKHEVANACFVLPFTNRSRENYLLGKWSAWPSLTTLFDLIKFNNDGKKILPSNESGILLLPPLARERFLRLATSPGRERILRSFLRLAAFVGFYEALLGCSRVESILQLFTYVYLVTRGRVQCSNNDELTPRIINESPR